MTCSFGGPNKHGNRKARDGITENANHQAAGTGRPLHARFNSEPRVKNVSNMSGHEDVTVELDSRDVTLSWSSREALFGALREQGGDEELADAICEAVEAVSPSRIVLLTLECKNYLLRLLEVLLLEAGGDDTTRPELSELRDGLVADLRDTERCEHSRSRASRWHRAADPTAAAVSRSASAARGRN